MIEEYKEIIHARTLKLTVKQWILHLSFILLPISLLIALNFFQSGGQETIQERQTFINWAIIIWIIYIVIVKLFELRFKVFDIKRSQSQFKDSVQASTLKLGWVPEKHSDKFFKALSPYNIWNGYDDQTVTILYTPDKIYINSITTPSILSRPSIIANRQNIKTFVKYYIKTKSTNVTEMVTIAFEDEAKFFWEHPEWNLKNTAKRAVAYILCFIFIYLMYLIYIDSGFNSIMIVIIPVSIGYIILDIYILIKKSRKKRGGS